VEVTESHERASWWVCGGWTKIGKGDNYQGRGWEECRGGKENCIGGVLTFCVWWQGHRVPWISILTSPCVWAIIITHGASVFGYFTVVNQLPTYMKHILHFNIKAVSCCFVLQAVVSFVALTLPVRTRWRSSLRHCAQGRIKLFGAPRQWKHFRPLSQTVFLSGGGVLPLRQSNNTPPSPKTEITNILFYILNFASIIKLKM